MKTTWRKELAIALAANGETAANIVSSTLTEQQLDRPFDDGYGGVEGEAFTIWTTNHVYFPIKYDGCEWVGSVARNPNGRATRHQGG